MGGNCVVQKPRDRCHQKLSKPFSIDDCQSWQMMDQSGLELMRGPLTVFVLGIEGGVSDGLMVAWLTESG